MNHRIIINVILVGIALIIAVFLGQWIVTAPKEVGVGFAIVAAIVIFLVMKQRVWMLVPTFMTLGISFPWMPGEFSPMELACMYLIGCTFVLLLSRRVSLRLQMTSIEWMALLVILMAIQAFVRNPAGVRLLQSEYVGGRPYFVMVIFVTASYILASTRTNYDEIKKVFVWSIWGYMASFGLHSIAKLSSSIAVFTGALFGAYGNHGGALGLNTDNAMANDGRAGRNSAALLYAQAASRWLVTQRNPLTALWHPFFGVVLLSALMGAGMSGFRNVVASTVFTLALGVYYWGRGKAVIMSSFIVVIVYLLINIVNMVSPLPPNVQRSLSFLPGTWETEHVEDAGASTDWRMDMWEEALFTESYIENKTLGDGLGVRRDDFSRMIEITFSPVITNEMSQERAMLAGDFHSGPVTTIRVIGYVGLFVLIVAMTVVAIRAHKLIMYSRGRPYFREVIFFCLPMVWFPIFFIFVFGSFKSSIPGFFIQMGLLRLLENNFKNRKEENSI